MEAWREEITANLLKLLGNPKTAFEAAVIGLATALLTAVVLAQCARAVGSERSGRLRMSLVLVMGLALALFVPVVERLCVEANLLHGMPESWLSILLGAVLFLMLLVPMTCLFCRINYLKGFIVMTAGVATAAIVVLLLHASFDAARNVTSDFTKIKGKKEKDEAFFREK